MISCNAVLLLMLQTVDANAGVPETDPSCDTTVNADEVGRSWSQCWDAVTGIFLGVLFRFHLKIRL